MSVVPKIRVDGAVVPAEPRRPVPVQASGTASQFMSLDDPRVVDMLRGVVTANGLSLTVEKALRVPTVFRCVALVSQSIGMLPLSVIDKETKLPAKDNPLRRILHRKPNDWQTAYEFRTLMQGRALVRGDAYARIVRSMDFQSRKKRVVSLIPLETQRMTVTQNRDFSLSYKYNRPEGGTINFDANDIFHLRDMSDNGITGLSRVQQAADAISLLSAANLALGRLYRNGSWVSGYIKHPETIDPETMATLKQQWDSRYAGPENAGGTPIFEEGMEYVPIGQNAKDAQITESRSKEIEEILRIFGVPRPLAMIDETSWGSGIDALGQFFVRYGLGPWFECWQQRCEFSLFDDEEAERYEVKFNPGALLRGSMKDQAEFFSKALGSGGTQAWMTPNEVRELLDMPAHDDGDTLGNPMTAPAASDPTNPANPPANPAKPKEPTDG